MNVDADPEWAPHVDLGKQLATLHSLLVDSLPKLPAAKMQVSKNTSVKSKDGIKTPPKEARIEVQKSSLNLYVEF